MNSYSIPVAQPFRQCEAQVDIASELKHLHPRSHIVSRSRLISLLIALLTLVVYFPVSRSVFINFDDPDYVYENPMVSNGLTAEGVRWAFTKFHSSNWHPLTSLSHMLDCQLFGLNASPQHWINVLFHAINAVLLFRLLLRMTDAQWLSAFVAAIFAWHPLHVESVAWISERKDVLSTLFGLLAIEAYVRFAQPDRSETVQGGLGRKLTQANQSWFNSKFYWLALLWFALGLLSKPMLVTLPFVFLLLDYWPMNRVGKLASSSELMQLILEKTPFFLLTVASSVVTYFAQKTDAVVSLERLPFGERVANAVISYMRYIGKTFWPTDLAIIYPMTDVKTVMLVSAIALLGLITVLVWLWRSRAPFLVTGWFWFLGMLVPVIGLVQVGAQALADRYMYLPMVGLLLMIAFGAKELVARFQFPTRIVAGLASVGCVACLAVTFHQTGFWRDSETVFRHAIEATGRNEIAELNLGVALEHADRKEEAAQHYFNALSINSNRSQTHNDIANVLADLGKYDEAQVHYLESLQRKPEALLTHMNYGTLLLDMGKPDEADAQYREAARISPKDPRPYYLMGKAALRQGRGADAVAQFREALQRDPNDFQSLTLLARIFAGAEDAGLRNGAEAVRLAEQANELTGGEQPLVIDSLAMAYAETGRFADAQKMSRASVELAEQLGKADMRQRFEKHLKLFEGNQPVREPLPELLARAAAR